MVVVASESTPLYSATYQSSSTGGSIEELNLLINNMFSKRNMDVARANLGNVGNVAVEQFQRLQDSASEGDLSLRLLALLSGIALVIKSGFGFLGLLVSFHITRAILEVYTVLLGLIMLMLELHGQLRQGQQRLSVEQQQQISVQVAFMENLFRNLFKYAMFLRYVWGRGCLYFVAGSLQLAQGKFMDLCIGVFVMFVGILYIFVGRQTATKLNLLRQSLAENALRSKFQEADKNGNGKLSLGEFQHLTESLGMNLTHRECEVAFLCMDQSDTGSITFSDFQKWWSDWEDGSVFV